MLEFASFGGIPIFPIICSSLACAAITKRQRSVYTRRELGRRDVAGGKVCAGGV